MAAKHRATEDSIPPVDRGHGVSAPVTTPNGKSKKKPWWKPPVSDPVWLLGFVLGVLIGGLSLWAGFLVWLAR